MGKMKHISGPWLLEQTTVYKLTDAVDYKGNPYWIKGERAQENAWSVNIQGHKHVSRDDKIKIARLISAAPDMLEALERCLAYIERDELAHGRQFGEGNVARAAISKAKGETT